jgi:hypothetical protein
MRSQCESVNKEEFYELNLQIKPGKDCRKFLFERTDPVFFVTSKVAPIDG